MTDVTNALATVATPSTTTSTSTSTSLVKATITSAITSTSTVSSTAVDSTTITKTEKVTATTAIPTTTLQKSTSTITVEATSTGTITSIETITSVATSTTTFSSVTKTTITSTISAVATERATYYYKIYAVYLIVYSETPAINAASGQDPSSKSVVNYSFATSEVFQAVHFESFSSNNKRTVFFYDSNTGLTRDGAGNVLSVAPLGGEYNRAGLLYMLPDQTKQGGGLSPLYLQCTRGEYTTTLATNKFTCTNQAFQLDTFYHCSADNRGVTQDENTPLLGITNAMSRINCQLHTLSIIAPAAQV